MYCKNCGKAISSIANECPYCKTKVNDTYDFKNIHKNYQNDSGLNKILYMGMNGKPVTVWKFILGLILLIGFPIIFIVFIS